MATFNLKKLRKKEREAKKKRTATQKRTIMPPQKGKKKSTKKGCGCGR